MSGSFSNWLDGGPVNDTGTAFEHWMDGGPVLSPEDSGPFVTTIFTGVIIRPRIKGQRIQATAVPGGLAFDLQVPRFILGPQCNHITGGDRTGLHLVSEGCGLLRADWRFTASVVGPVNADYPFELLIENLARDTGPTPDYFEGWFANGVIEWGTGEDIQRRRILTSTDPVSDAMTIQLARWFTGVGPQPSDPVTIYPSCDGRRETCRAYHTSENPQGKFDNYLQFGAHLFVPPGNPSLLKVSDNVAAGGKK